MSEIEFSDGIPNRKENYNAIVYPEALLDKKFGKEKIMVKVLVCVAMSIILILIALFMLGVYATYSVAKYMNDSSMH